MSLPSATVVVPTHRRPQQVARCVAALEALNYPRDLLEILVIDDEDGAGPSAARNMGLEAARGEVVAFTDDDCEPAPDWLRLLAAAWRDDPTRAYGGTVENALEHDLAAEVAQRIIRAGYSQLNEPGDARFLTSNNLLLPTAALRELGGFEVSLRSSEDRDLCDRWRLSGRRLEHVREAVVRHSHIGGMREFWRQHVAYARGSRRFHVLHRQRTGSLPRIEPSFYARLLRQPGEPLLPSAALMGLWLAATGYGYAAEALRRGGAT
jgi:cellulose synthase/poly-beta-1,6-N-acetylglucosamine synthase-like glycosyltransferase